MNPIVKVDVTQLNKHKEEKKVYYFSNILCYSQICSKDHLYKTTIRLMVSAQANSHSIVALRDNHLYNSTSNLFLSFPNSKRTCIKQHYKPFLRVENKHKETYTGIKSAFGTQSNICGAYFFAKKVNS